MSLVNDLFQYDDWENSDTQIFAYYNIELLVDIGPYKKGTKFHSAYFDMYNGLVRFYDSDGKSTDSFLLKIHAKI